MFRKGIKMRKISIPLGTEFKINGEIYRWIKVTEKGYNLLNVNSNEVGLKGKARNTNQHFYKIKESKNSFIVTQIFGLLLSESLISKDKIDE